MIADLIPRLIQWSGFLNGQLLSPTANVVIAELLVRMHELLSTCPTLPRKATTSAADTSLYLATLTSPTDVQKQLSRTSGGI